MARIELKSLAHSYKAAPAEPTDYALRQMDMAWDDGGAYALLGPSGCGKTTLLKCIVGKLRVDSGSVLVFGDSPGSEASGVPGSRVGYMPQELALFGEFNIGSPKQLGEILFDARDPIGGGAGDLDPHHGGAVDRRQEDPPERASHRQRVALLERLGRHPAEGGRQALPLDATRTLEHQPRHALGPLTSSTARR